MRHQGDTYYDEMFKHRTGFTAWVDHTNRKSGVVKDVTPLVKEFTVTRELSGDLPGQVSLVGGGVAVAASIRADAAMPSAPHPLKPADRAGWIASRMQLSAGFDLDALEVFTGKVREFAFDEEGWGLTLDLIDGRDDLRAPVTLPAYGSVTTRVAPGRFQRYPTNLAAVIVAALHRNNIRLTPAPAEAACVFSAPLVFGAIADKGWTIPIGSGVVDAVPWLVPGKFGPMPSGPGGYGYWSLQCYPSSSVIWGASSSNLRLEFFADTSGLSGATDPVTLYVGATGQARVTLGPTSISSRVWNGSTWAAGPSLPVTPGWHHISLTVSYLEGLTLWVDGVAATADLGTSAMPPLGHGPTRIDLNLGRIQQVSLHSWTVSTPRTSPTFEPTFKPQADVDRALLEVDYLPAIDGRNAWELCKEIAAAELGMVGFDETGRFYFKNRDTLNAPVVPVATWGTDLVDNVRGSATADSVRTRVTALVEPKVFISSGRGASTELSTAVPVAMADDVLTLPIGYSTHIISASEPWCAVSAFVEPITAIGRAWDVDNGMAICSDALGGSLYTAGGIDATLSMLSPTSASLKVRNTSGATRYAVWPAAWTGPTYKDPPFGLDKGSPAVWVNGRGLTGDYKIVSVDRTDVLALADWGDRALVLDANAWRQHPTSVELLADRLLADLKEPRAELEDITVPADVRWQIGDPILLTDWKGRLPDVLARITRIELTVSNEVESGIVGRYSLRTIPQ